VARLLYVWLASCVLWVARDGSGVLHRWRRKRTLKKTWRRRGRWARACVNQSGVAARRTTRCDARWVGGFAFCLRTFVTPDAAFLPGADVFCRAGTPALYISRLVNASVVVSLSLYASAISMCSLFGDPHLFPHTIYLIPRCLVVGLLSSDMFLFTAVRFLRVVVCGFAGWVCCWFGCVVNFVLPR
jgi:hypothetical protein